MPNSDLILSVMLVPNLALCSTPTTVYERTVHTTSINCVNPRDVLLQLRRQWENEEGSKLVRYAAPKS